MAMPRKRAEYNAYMRVYMLKRYHEKRALAVKALGGKCAKCGNTQRLEIDHKNSKNKTFDISKRLHTAPVAEIAKELKKAQLLCRPCHSLKSVFDAGNKPARHGGATMYTHHRCRCAPCREGNAKRVREWKLRTGRVRNPRKPHGLLSQ